MIDEGLSDFMLRNSVDDGDCRIWTGRRLPSGYGIIKKSGKTLYAHRESYAANVGLIPADLYVLHRCDRPACIQPAHLFVGTQLDNIRDMDAKGRRGFSRPHHVRRGTEHHFARLTEDDVRSIRQSNALHRELAAIYGVSRQSISRIKTGRRWSHV